MNIHEILDYIREDASDEHLDMIRNALKGAERSAEIDKLYSFRVGQKVKFNHTARPQYMIGQLATITKVNRSRVVIRLDSPAGRFSAGDIRCPVSLLDPV